MEPSTLIRWFTNSVSWVVDKEHKEASSQLSTELEGSISSMVYVYAYYIHIPIKLEVTRERCQVTSTLALHLIQDIQGT